MHAPEYWEARKPHPKVTDSFPLARSVGFFRGHKSTLLKAESSKKQLFYCVSMRRCPFCWLKRICSKDCTSLHVQMHYSLDPAMQASQKYCDRPNDTFP